MSTALALRAPADLDSPARLGAGMALQTLAGTVSAFFALESFDERRGVAIYALRVVNRTASALICRTWVLSRSGDAALAYPISLEVQPLTTSATQVPVWPKDFASFDRAIAEVAGEGVHCIVEAAVPAYHTPRPYGRWMLAGLAAVVLAFGAAGALRAALPRIAAFAVPPEALAGTTVTAEYGASGAGALTYSVTAPDGRRLQGGTLAERSGSIPIAIPASVHAGALTLRMVMSGPLGTASETRVLNAIAGRGGGSAEIQDVSVRPVVARPGESVDVAYAATGDEGYVRLLGADGTIWEQRPFSRGGQTRLVVPAVSSPREMRVVLHVTKGASTAQSMAGLVVASPGAQPPASVAGIAGDDNPAAPSTSDAANGTFEVLTPTVKSGGTIRVRILSPRNGMRLSLTDDQSREVAGISTGAEADVVTLRAPIVTVPTRYTVVAGFTDGFGQESIVQPVTITP